MKSNIVLYALLILVAVILVFSVKSMLSQKTYSQEDYNNYLSAEGQDKCKTPDGYSDEEWKEHMSHHPDRYKECLI